ncbi:FtsX-like permease family protein [Xylocopilactobacillus apis]|uniref:Putative hemin transport system permease protein HrtB n=1 Tax=Xylocopilactobacillus apis TaxID=2932183 RepID=A0AAU9CZB7_9LACO|nr:FtsX-like permease family protein [Xylocopilactobacillus apis]BDR56608.1 peptide ABC transporter permease [Xylocopilactobacillus apis]
MFLAIKEIKHEKLRYGLIIGMVMLISYLVYFLSGLATGLAAQNTQAIESWDTQTIVLNKDANVSLTQSLITTSQSKDLNLSNHESYVGQTPVIAKQSGHKSVSTQFIGVEKDSDIYDKVKIESGRKVENDNELVADDTLKNNGYKLNDEIKLSSSTKKYQIVGFTKNAKLDIAPVLYGTLSTWRTLKSLPQTFKASGIVSTSKDFNVKESGLKAYPVSKFIVKLPGYSAQNLTFTFMIAFLMIISMVVIAIFLYILTIQKLPNYGVLRAQGIPAHTLIINTISQAVLIVAIGIIAGAIITLITVKFLPSAVPVAMDYSSLAGVTAGMLLTGVIGSLIPVHLIRKVDPIQLID